MCFSRRCQRRLEAHRQAGAHDLKPSVKAPAKPATTKAPATTTQPKDEPEPEWAPEDVYYARCAATQAAGAAPCMPETRDTAPHWTVTGTASPVSADRYVDATDQWSVALVRRLDQRVIR